MVKISKDIPEDKEERGLTQPFTKTELIKVVLMQRWTNRSWKE